MKSSHGIGTCNLLVILRIVHMYSGGMGTSILVDRYLFTAVCSPCRLTNTSLQNVQLCMDNNNSMALLVSNQQPVNTKHHTAHLVLVLTIQWNTS